MTKVKLGRKFKAFGTKLEIDKAFSVTAAEDKVIKKLCKKFDLAEARLFRQIIFGVTAQIKLNKE